MQSRYSHCDRLRLKVLSCCYTSLHCGQKVSDVEVRRRISWDASGYWCSNYESELFDPVYSVATKPEVEGRGVVFTPKMKAKIMRHE